MCALAPLALSAQTLPPWERVTPKAGASALPATPPAAPSPAQPTPAQTLPPWERVTPPKTGASALPATPPTSQSPGQPPPALNAVPAPIAAAPVVNKTPARLAQVTYSGGLIDVRANNSSLHQILRAISRQTGMSISGGIADDRVFGNYGPATPSSVLATLIDGTGTNMLLREGDATHPMELVLSPQAGAASTTSGTSIGSDADNAPGPEAFPAQPPEASPPPAQPSPAAATPTSAPSRVISPANITQPVNGVNGSPSNTSPTASTFPTTNSVPLDSLPAPSTTPPSSGIVNSPNPPTNSATPGTATTPGATAPASTPEQIYQQLLKMQQQQTTPSSSTPPQ